MKDELVRTFHWKEMNKNLEVSSLLSLLPPGEGVKDEESLGLSPSTGTETDRARMNPKLISEMGLVPLFKTDQSFEDISSST